MRFLIISIIIPAFYWIGLLSAQESGGLNLQLTPTLPDHLRIHSKNGAEYDRASGFIRYMGGVQVYGDNGMQMFANRAIVNTQAQTIHFDGDVQIYQNSVLHRGTKASYHYGNQILDTSQLRTSIDPILLDSDSFTMEQRGVKKVFIGNNASLTTDDKQKPGFWLRAKKIEVHPEEKVVLQNIRLYAGETPIFWLPYLSQPLDDQLGYHFNIGARSNWGAFLLNSYGIMLGGENDPATGIKRDQWLLSEWKFDLRSKRGAAGGVDFSDVRLKDNPNLGWLNLYFAHDSDPALSRTAVTRNAINRNRFSVELKSRYSWDSGTDSTFILDANTTLLSDEYYLEDFRPRQYTYDAQPENLLGFRSVSDSSQWGLFTRYSLNDFYQSDVRLPEIYLDIAKRPLLDSPVLYESSSSIGYYREDLTNLEQSRLLAEANDPGTSTSRIDAIRAQLRRNDFFRAHTYHELSLPFHITNGFTMTPRAGAGYTYYWNEGERNADFGSPHLYLGLDTALKFTRIFPNVRNETWGLNQLMHVFQPYSNLSILSTKEHNSTSRIDRLISTERPRPFDVARFNAIDDYQNWSIVRLGVRNQLLTKRDGSSFNWLTLDTYVDSFLNDPEFNRNFSNLYNDLKWNPVPWGSLSLRTQSPINSEGFTEISTYLGFLPCENVELLLGHSLLDDHPTIEDSNYFNLQSYFRLNYEWGIATNHSWQLDDNVLERQEYSVYKNINGWNIGVGIFQRNNRINKESGAVLSFSLNALHSLNLPFSLSAE